MDKAVQTRSIFSQKVEVATDIRARPEVIWALLTNVRDMPRWNSTLISLEGELVEGGKITLKATLDPKRSFKLKVNELLEEKRMVWASGTTPFFKGLRTYELNPLSSSLTRFSMTEKLSGLMFPLAVGQLPDFSASFEQFAVDLKKEAELIAE